MQSALQRERPETPDGSEPTVTGCIGITLGLLDDWLCAERFTAPAGLGERVDAPVTDGDGDRAAAEII